MWLINNRSGGHIKVDDVFYKELTRQYQMMFVAEKQADHVAGGTPKGVAYLPDWVTKDSSVFYNNGSFFATPATEVAE